MIKGNEEYPLLIRGLGALVVVFLVMNKNYFVYYKPRATFGVVALTTFFFYLMRKSDFVVIATALFLIGLLEVLDNSLWKYRPFLWMFTVEDFSGTYDGRQISKYNKSTGKTSNGKRNTYEEHEESTRIVLVIKQNGSSLAVSSFYFDAQGKKRLKFESTKIVVSKTGDDQHYILTCHHGELGVLKDEGNHGTTVLKMIKKENIFSVEGGYYTNRNSQTRGEFVDLKRVSRLMLHPF